MELGNGINLAIPSARARSIYVTTMPNGRATFEQVTALSASKGKITRVVFSAFSFYKHNKRTKPISGCAQDDSLTRQERHFGPCHSGKAASRSALFLAAPGQSEKNRKVTITPTSICTGAIVAHRTCRVSHVAVGKTKKKREKTEFDYK